MHFELRSRIEAYRVVPLGRQVASHHSHDGSPGRLVRQRADLAEFGRSAARTNSQETISKKYFQLGVRNISNKKTALNSQ